jgi:hypothetical protein
VLVLTLASRSVKSRNAARSPMGAKKPVVPSSTMAVSLLSFLSATTTCTCGIASVGDRCGDDSSSQQRAVLSSFNQVRSCDAAS